MEANAPAVEGGAPVRSGAPVPFFRADLTEADIQAVVETLRSGWLTLGPRTAAFETACSEYLQTQHAVATSSCTAALFLALRALELSPGDEVIVPSLTFPSTVSTIRHVGAEPVLADIETLGFGIDAGEVEALWTPRTRAVVAVDYAGQPCDLDALTALCAERGVALIEDAAHSFGAAHRGKPVGAWADATAFSFYATKCITTGEGGLLTCRDEDVAQRARLLGFHGMQRDAWKRYSDRGSWFYEIELAGYKCNMSDMQAALGMSQLQRADALRASRTRTALRYAEAFADLEALILPEVREHSLHAWHLFVVQLDAQRLRIGRDQFAQALREEGVVPSVHFIPYHRHPVARSATTRRPLERTDVFASRCLSLPLFPHMPDGDFDAVVEAVRKLVRFYAR